jgi:hypothetical protein
MFTKILMDLSYQDQPQMLLLCDLHRCHIKYGTGDCPYICAGE